eukprot:SAG31_NODE_8228_length_1493_cov_1.910330_2_plen_101_part_01
MQRPLEDFSHVALDSPFPHSRFEGTGYQACRFQWALADELMRRNPVDGSLAVPDRRFAHRQKSYVSPLEVRSISLKHSHIAQTSAARTHTQNLCALLRIIL